MCWYWQLSMYRCVDNINVVLVNVGDVRLIYVDQDMDKCRTDVNIRYSEQQIALRQQLVSQTYIKFIINLFRHQNRGSHRNWRAKYGPPLSLFNWIFVFQRVSNPIPLIAVRNKCTGFNDACWWRGFHLGSHTTWDRQRSFGRTCASIFRMTELRLLRGLLRRKSVTLKTEAAVLSESCQLVLQLLM